MDAVSIHEAKAHFSRLVARAEAAEEIVVCRGSTPVAKIVACRVPTTPRRPGALKGEIESAINSTRRSRTSANTREPAVDDTHRAPVGASVGLTASSEGDLPSQRGET